MTPEQRAKDKELCARIMAFGAAHFEGIQLARKMPEYISEVERLEARVKELEERERIRTSPGHDVSDMYQ